MAAQQTMMGMSDQPGQFRPEPMLALMNQAWRARSGQDDGMNYQAIPF